MQQGTLDSNTSYPKGTADLRAALVAKINQLKNPENMDIHDNLGQQQSQKSACEQEEKEPEIMTEPANDMGPPPFPAAARPDYNSHTTLPNDSPALNGDASSLNNHDTQLSDASRAQSQTGGIATDVQTSEPLTQQNKTVLSDYFLEAAKTGDLYLINQYAEEKSDINVTNVYGMNALMLATLYGQFEIATQLVETYQINLAHKDIYGIRLLKGYIDQNNLEIETFITNMKIFEEHEPLGANVLLYASYAGNSTLFDYFVGQPGVNVNVVDSFGINALLAAALGGQPAMLDHLVKKYHFNLSVVDKHGHNALLAATANAQIPMIKYLYEQHPKEFPITKNVKHHVAARLWIQSESSEPIDNWAE